MKRFDFLVTVFTIVIFVATYLIIGKEAFFEIVKGIGGPLAVPGDR
ncbi:hypothetical protein [Priestia endophytica]|nr:hypothetical protein [Priestia endophytica]